jgi:hypothetical protein
MSSQPIRRRAYAADAWEKIQKSRAVEKDIVSNTVSESGKLNPEQGKVRSFTVERRKVLGILEENEDGTVSIASFEPTRNEPVPENAPTAKSEGADITTEGATWMSPILKAEESDDGEMRLVTSVVLAPETVDLQGDIYDEEVIRKAAHDYVREYNQDTTVGYMHKDMNKSLDLVESWIAPVDMTVSGREIRKGTWLMTVQVVDKAIWAQVKKGEIRGFSIGGIAKVQKLPA